jgi:hypothetical protein
VGYPNTLHPVWLVTCKTQRPIPTFQTLNSERLPQGWRGSAGRNRGGGSGHGGESRPGEGGLCGGHPLPRGPPILIENYLTVWGSCHPRHPKKTPKFGTMEESREQGRFCFAADTSGYTPRVSVCFLGVKIYFTVGDLAVLETLRKFQNPGPCTPTPQP